MVGRLAWRKGRLVHCWLLAVLIAAFAPAACGQVPEGLMPPPRVAPAAAPAEAPVADADVAEVEAGNAAVEGSETPAAASLDAFVDGVVEAYMRTDHIAGVVVAIVDRQGTLFRKGYGTAGGEPARPVDPETTLFRIGSISKTFTYVAAMQLAASGVIDLEADVNTLLPPELAIPAEGYGPVRVLDLMQHTAGFEDSGLGHLFMRDAATVPGLAAYLARYRPQRVRPPGLHAVYSNYSVGLLGALIAARSGLPFEDYVEQRLLQPLGMAGDATFREPLGQADPRHMGPALAARLATGFWREGGGYAPQAFEFISGVAPAGAVSASAAGMERWMRMLLNGGSLDGATVLEPAAFARLAEVSFRNAPDVAGIAHGFFRQRYGRYESLEHAGATLSFLSNMVVLPEAELGIFISTNTDTGRPLVMALPQLVFARLLPEAREAAPPPVAMTQAELARYTGTWRNERRAYSTLEKLLDAAGTDLGVRGDDDGKLVVAGGGGEHRYQPLGDGVFRDLDDGSRIAFVPTMDGKGLLLAAAYGHTVSDRVGWLDSSSTLGGLLALLGLLSLGVLLGAWHRRALRPAHHGRGAALALGLAAVAWLAWIAAAAIVLLQAAGDGGNLIYEYPGTGLRTVVALAYACAVLTLLAVLTLGSALRARDWSRWRKFRHLAVLLAMVMTTVLLVRWNVLFAPLGLGT